jgi:hypothetical protein
MEREGRFIPGPEQMIPESVEINQEHYANALPFSIEDGASCARGLGAAILGGGPEMGGQSEAEESLGVLVEMCQDGNSNTWRDFTLEEIRAKANANVATNKLRFGGHTVGDTIERLARIRPSMIGVNEVDGVKRYFPTPELVQILVDNNRMRSQV